MNVKIRLPDGIVFTVWNKNLKQTYKYWKQATYHDELMEIDNGQGKTRFINPRQVIYIEGDS